MANIRKLDVFKKLSGTSRKDRQVTESVNFEIVDKIPQAPDWLSETASTEWNRLASILVNNRVLTNADFSSLAILCSLHARIVQSFSSGECPSGHVLSQYRYLINDFGLTPVSRGKVSSFGAPKKENPFTRNGKRPA